MEHQVILVESAAEKIPELKTERIDVRRWHAARLRGAKGYRLRRPSRQTQMPLDQGTAKRRCLSARKRGPKRQSDVNPRPNR